jgi:hypothetical protein
MVRNNGVEETMQMEDLVEKQPCKIRSWECFLAWDEVHISHQSVTNDPD